MKPLTPFLAALAFLAFAQSASAQKDTVITYVDEKLNMVPDSLAVAVSIAFRRDSIWEVLYYNMDNQKRIMTAYAKDPTCKTLHGLYESFHADGRKLSSKGWFNEGKKIGVWRTWNEDGDLTDSAVYENGEMSRRYKSFITGPQLVHMSDDYKVDTSLYTDLIVESGFLYHVSRRQQGVKENWSYHDNGKLFKYVKWEGQKTLEERCYLATGELAKDCKKVIRQKTETKSPEFPGGMGNMQLYLANNLYIPPDFNTAIRADYTGSVSFMLTEKGKPYEVKIVQSSHPDLDKPLRDVIQNMPHWNMKSHKGTYGPIVLPLRFNLAMSSNQRRERQFNSRSTGFEDY